ncbi:hypothetical protein R0K17_12505 [Planococcus sp. SIMBA_143]
MDNDEKTEKERKKLELKRKEEEFNKRLGDDPKALQNQSKSTQIIWWIIIFLIIFFGFEIFLFLISFLQ